MRRLFTILIFSFIFGNILNAGGGIWEYYLHINSIWYGNQGSNIPLNGAVLSNNIILNSSTLTIDTRGINTWQDNGCNVTSAHFNYRIFKQGDTPPSSFTVVNLTYQSQGGNNKYWNDNGPVIDLLQGITESGTYVFEVYFDAPTNGTNCAGTLYDNNGGSNYKATFIVTGTLPLNLLYFDAINLGNKQIKLSWASNFENHADVFEIQYSKDGSYFYSIGEIKSNSINKYEFIHNNPEQSVSYYRLKQTDQYGLITFSSIRVVEFLENQIKLSPNPANKKLFIRGMDSTSQIVSIIDQNGKELFRGTTNSDYFEVDIESFQPGIYFVRIHNSLDTKSFRFIKS